MTNTRPNKRLRFTRSRGLMRVRKAPGPKWSTIFSVLVTPTLHEMLLGKASFALGTIEWVPKFKQYCFLPYRDVAVRGNTLGLIGEFCQTETRKLNKRNTK